MGDRPGNEQLIIEGQGQDCTVGSICPWPHTCLPLSAWASYLITLCLSFFPCKIGLLIVSNFWGSSKD